jgi:cardiolipin-specific phospholipase
MSWLWQSIRRLYVPSSPEDLEASQRRLLRKYVHAPFEERKVRLSSGDYINAVVFHNQRSRDYEVAAAAAAAADSASIDTIASTSTAPVPLPPPPTTLVITHGYGSGLAFFWENYDFFCSHFDRVIGIDWLGMGGSSRPQKESWCSSWTSSSTGGSGASGADLPTKYSAPVYKPPRKCASFSLASSGIAATSTEARSSSSGGSGSSSSGDDASLGGQYGAVATTATQASDGGYVSPAASVSVNTDDATSTTTASAAASEDQAVDFFIDSLEEFRRIERIPSMVLAGHSLGGYLSTRYALKHGDDGVVQGLMLFSPVGLPPQPDEESRVPESQLPFRVRTISRLWRWDFTPQQIVRMAGPKGKAMVRSAVQRRFRDRPWSEEEVDLISDYLYHITVADPSGEYAMNSILQLMVSDSGFGVYARQPLHDAVPQLNVPVLLLFGDNDWMLPRGTLMSRLQAHWRSRGKEDVSVGIVPSAGHHLYFDNTDQFHASIEAWLREYRIGNRASGSPSSSSSVAASEPLN